MKCLRTIVLAGALLLGLMLTADAAYPPFIDYQGRLTDAVGNPVGDGTYSIVFRIYDAYTGGTALWTSDPMSVNVHEGLFSTILGEIGSTVFVPAGDRFLGITVGVDPEMTPRTWLVTVPYAYYAGNAGASATCPAWAINGDNVYHSEGNVGIGVNNPQEPLEVGMHFAGFNGTFITVGDPSTYELAGIAFGADWDHYVSMVCADSANQFAIMQRLGPSTHTLFYANNGNVSIGHSDPELRFEVGSEGTGDGMRVLRAYAGTQLFRVRENSDGSCELQVSDDAGTVQAMIRASAASYFNGGAVGIGTSSPNYTLDVRGTIGNNTTLYHSDERWKRNIAPLDGALESVMQLRGVRYEWKTEEYPDMNFPADRQIGLIAQEVEPVVPEVVNTAEDGYKSIDYAKLLAVMTEAIKTQQEQIESLNARIEELEKAK